MPYSKPSDNFILSSGKPYPYGVEIKGNLYNFALYCQEALTVVLLFFQRGEEKPLFEIPLQAPMNRTGNVWHIALKGIDPTYSYAYRISKSACPLPSSKEEDFIVLDPYATGVIARDRWGVASYLLQGELPSPEPFDWEGDIPPRHARQDLLIYEMHVRAFTQDPSSNVVHPGTYLGVIEKIDHLCSLGVNAIELLPCQEFDECENFRRNPFDNTPLYNFWGYSPLAYFAPMGRYATSNAPFAAVTEFKMMVKELHKQGIEVLLDVVFNHTAEAGLEGPTISFKALALPHYYIENERGELQDFSGCGNTFNANHPISMEFIINCLRYWVIEMHVDGFRFDLASTFCRGIKGELLEWAPIIEALSSDPILAGVRLIAEPWDAVSLYQVGSFPGNLPWMEWNGQYRDAVRNFIKGSGKKGEFATRLSGSQDLYRPYNPQRSINFVTAHDGFTLSDLVRYNRKHNLSNGEEDRDGMNHNDSWNCGVEGESENSAIKALRSRQQKNFLLALLVSQGIPMLLMGDEYGHTKKGNNNSWCQDNRTNWFQWDQLEEVEGAAFFRYYQTLLHFRQKYPIFKCSSFLSESHVQWHSMTPNLPQWHLSDGFLAFTLFDEELHEEIYIAFNSQGKSTSVTFPSCRFGKWQWIVNTSSSHPDDIFTEDTAPCVTSQHYTMLPYSALLLRAIKEN